VRQAWVLRAGSWATHKLGLELKRLGFRGRVDLVGDSAAQRLLQPIWNSVLPAERIEPLVLPSGGESIREEVTRLGNLAQGKSAVAVVGAGGGKATDRPALWPTN